MEPTYYDMLVTAEVNIENALDAISKAFELCPDEPYDAAIEKKAMEELRELKIRIAQRRSEHLKET
jgi:hypothetical protein